MLDPEAIRQALAGHSGRSIPLGALRSAAVLLPLLVTEGTDHILFTRRTDHLPHHAGEISFPGGARHPQDTDLLATALRETEEEIGIRPVDVEVLGRLGDFSSPYGYHVTPFVGRIPWPYPLRASLCETAAVFTLPVAALLDPSVCRRESWLDRGRPEPVYFYTVGGQVVWGLTAAILRQFLRQIEPLLPPGFRSSLQKGDKSV